MKTRTSMVLALVLAAGGCGDTRGADAGVRDAGGSMMDSAVDSDGGADTDAGDSTDAGDATDAGGGTEAGGGTDAGDTDAGPPGGAHLLISEVASQGANAEFVEIWNPTGAAVDLTRYFISDNAIYTDVNSGGPWDPDGTPGTDFLMQFPPGTSLGPDEVLVVAGSLLFFDEYAACPDFYITEDESPVACGGAMVPSLLIPSGGLGSGSGRSISNSREMLILFTWDGSSSTVQDVDYVTWGTDFDDATRVDKTAVAGYRPDTTRAAQRAVAGPGPGSSIQRCSDVEADETPAGGNGITGHDETSEDLAASFAATDARTPGMKNPCISP